MAQGPPVPPLIGVTGSERHVDGQTCYAVAKAYAAAIQAAGGLPVLLTLEYEPARVEAVLERIDGLVLSGGGDLDPRHYGQFPQPGLGRIEPLRDRLELALTRAALAKAMPLLALCRGMQVLAVAVGGVLVQDLAPAAPSRIKHEQQAPRWYPTHPVRLKPNSRLAALLNTTDLDVNSFHHQAVQQVPPPLAVCGQAPDGVIEALEHPTLPFCFGVQWHPEALAAGDPVSRRLFEGLVTAARQYRDGRTTGANGKHGADRAQTDLRTDR